MKVDLDKIHKEDISTVIGLLNEYEELIKNRDYVSLYKNLRYAVDYVQFSERIIGSITSALYASGIDPLRYMTEVPTSFLTKSHCVSGDFVIPSNISTIRKVAFLGCAYLENVAISPGVEIIGYGAFFGCQKIKCVFIPSSVTNIGQQAFDGCRYLKSIKFTGTKKQWEYIEKGIAWDNNTGDYTVHCADGDINKTVQHPLKK